MNQLVETNLTGSLEAKLEALFQAALDDAFRAALASTVEAALKPRGKEPIVSDALYSPDEAAGVCGCSYTTINNARNSGNLVAHSIGGKPKFWGRDLRRWVNSGGRTGRSLATMRSASKKH